MSFNLGYSGSTRTSQGVNIVAQTQDDGKLEMFRKAITEKATVERDEILKETEQIKKIELDKEENRLLEELYAHIQANITKIKTENIKNISRETLQLKKALYKKREQYLDSIVEQVRVRLMEFCDGPDYAGYLKNKCAELAGKYPGEQCDLRVRSKDLAHADLLRGAFGGCEIEADDSSIAIGGLVLVNRARGLEIDSSLDSALREERERFYTNPEFQIDPTGGGKLE